LELTGVNSKPRGIPEGKVGKSLAEYRAKFVATHSSSEVTRSELERQLSVLLTAKTEREQLIARQTDELAEKSALLEQAEANVAEGKRRAGLELVDMQSKLKSTEAKLDELLLFFDQQIGRHEEELGNVSAKLEAKESELDALRLRLADAEKGLTSLDVLVASPHQQVEQYQKELTNVRAKLEAKESELELVRLRLSDAEKGSTKSKAETLRYAQDATGSVNRDEDQVTRRLIERVQAIEAEMAIKRWNEKSMEEMECSNEKSIEEMEYRNEG
jgi:chromosome segregation ATPase